MVLVIIAVITAGILFLAVKPISEGFSSQVTKDTCRASIVARGIELKGISVGQIFGSSLKCETEKKCISMGGTCPKNYEVITVSNENAIKKELANSMADCWSMVGEGEINFFGKNALETKNCIFCSVIHFDENVQKKYPQINGLTDYILNNQVPGMSKTYFDYMFTASAQKDVKPVTIDTSQDYSVNFAMVKGGYLWGILGKTAIVGGVLYVIGTGGFGAIPVLVGITKYGAVAGAAYIGMGMAKQTSVADVMLAINPYTPESIKEQECNNIESIP